MECPRRQRCCELRDATHSTAQRCYGTKIIPSRSSGPVFSCENPSGRPQSPSRRSCPAWPSRKRAATSANTTSVSPARSSAVSPAPCSATPFQATAASPAERSSAPSPARRSAIRWPGAPSIAAMPTATMTAKAAGTRPPFRPRTPPAITTETAVGSKVGPPATMTSMVAGSRRTHRPRSAATMMAGAAMCRPPHRATMIRMAVGSPGSRAATMTMAVGSPDRRAVDTMKTAAG